eukprot:Skav200346  [mRNA]  locus=scaffold2819:33214:33951:- [translate_table: standard]
MLNSFVSRYPANRIIVLSFFDGIGAGPLAVHLLAGTPRLVITWETDPECIKVTSTRFPHVHHRGDALRDDYTKVAALVREHDEQGECLLVVTAGPPCPDFSTIMNKSEGRLGQEGSKFTDLTNILDTLEKELPNHTFAHLIENVVMADPSDSRYFSDRLQAEPVLVDAAGNSPVSLVDKTAMDGHQEPPLNGKATEVGTTEPPPATPDVNAQTSQGGLQPGRIGASPRCVDGQEEDSMLHHPQPG